jgi:hypothetical protein
MSGMMKTGHIDKKKRNTGTPSQSKVAAAPATMVAMDVFCITPAVASASSFINTTEPSLASVIPNQATSTSPSPATVIPASPSLSVVPPLVDNTFEIDVDTGVEAPEPTEDPIVSDLVSSFLARDTLPPRYRSNLLLDKDLNNGCYVHQYYYALGIQKEGQHDLPPSFQANMAKRFGYVINGDTYSGLFDHLRGDQELMNMFELEQWVFAHHQVTGEYSGMQHLISMDPLLYMVVAGKKRRYRQLVCLSTMGPIQVDLHTANVTIVKETEPPTEPPAGIVLLLHYIALAATTGIERYRDPSKSSYVSSVYSRRQSVALMGGLGTIRRNAVLIRSAMH